MFPDFCCIFLCMNDNTTLLASVGLAQARPNNTLIEQSVNLHIQYIASYAGDTQAL